MMTEIATFFDESTCWEKKSELLFVEDASSGAVICQQQEIPAFTRLLIEKAKFAFVEQPTHRFSTSKMEIVISNESTVPNSTIKPLYVLPCYTPITNQHLGTVLIPQTSWIARIHHRSRGVDSAHTNCTLLVDPANDWTLQVHSTRHICSREPFRLFVPRTVQEERPMADNLFHTRCVSPWLPVALYGTGPIFAPLLLSTEPISSTMLRSQLSESPGQVLQPWQMFVLFYALRILLDPGKYKVQDLVIEFNSEYNANRNSAPFLFQSLFVEGLLNTSINSKWFTHFCARILMNALK